MIKGKELKIVFLGLLSFVIFIVNAMEHHKFEKCEKKGFCNRLRMQTSSEEEHKKLSSHYIVDTNSIKVDNSKFSAVLKSTARSDMKKQIYHDDLFFTVQLLERDIFRLRIKEVDTPVTDVQQFWESEKPKRRSTKDVLMEQSQKERNFITKTSDGVTRIKRDNSNVEFEIFHGNENKQFQAKLVVNGVESVLLNGRSLLTVESVFKKENPPESIIQENNTISYEGETAVGVDLTFVQASHVYGIPERATNLALSPSRGKDINSEPYRMYNLDIFRYELDNKIGLYGAIPLLFGVNPKVTSAVFVLNPSETFVDISKEDSGTSSHWMSETGIVDIFFLPGPTPKDAIAQYSFLTGTSPLPQLFSLAYHQCRWNYKDEEDVRTVDAKFDEHAIPYDVLWLDIEHTEDKKYFTWDRHYFPRPEEMIKNIAKKGRKMVTISDPHIKRTPGYFVHDEATANHYYVQKAGGGDYDGHCWPGSSSWLDYLNPTVRDFYASLFSFDKYKGSTETLYTWIDMNEPSVFSGPEITMHKDAKHFGDIEHKEVHNQYGFYHAMATYQGHIQRRQGQDRPFILTRSFFAGSQRYAAVWTGDNEAKWEHLDKAQPMVMSLSICGINYIGADVGGFFDNPEPELLVRWYQAGAFYPFFRAHAHIETMRREPWLFGDENTHLIREAIKRRYKLLPFYYTLSYHNSLTGIPIIRPLFVEYPQDINTYNIQDQFIIGQDIMVKPVVSKGSNVFEVYFPGEQPWYQWEEGKQVDVIDNKATVYTPIDYVPVFQRGGSIVPMKFTVRRSSTQMMSDPFTLQIALDNNQKASGDLYIDDGHSFNYKNGDYIFRQFTFENNELKASQGNSSLNDVKPNGRYHVSNTIERIIVLGYPQSPSKIYVTKASEENNLQLQQLIDFTYNSRSKQLIIAKPLLPILTDWIVKIEQ